MARCVADLALPDAVIVGEIDVNLPLAPATLNGLRLGVFRPYFFSSLDEDTSEVIAATLELFRAAGIDIVEVDMPALDELNRAVGMPVALYEAYDDLSAYLKQWNTGISLQQLAAGIASPDVRMFFENFVLPRKLPPASPQGAPQPAEPLYRAALSRTRPILQQLYLDTFSTYRIEALVFPTSPAVAMLSDSAASSPDKFAFYSRNTDPGSNVGVPGLALPAGIGKRSHLPVGLELDGPVGSDRRLLAIGLAVEQLLIGARTIAFKS